MSRLVLVLCCFVLFALSKVDSVETGKNINEHQDGSKVNDLEDQLDDIIKSNGDKTAEIPEAVISEDDLGQENSEENDVNSKRSYGGYRSTSSSYGKLLPSWMTMNHLVDSLVRAHLRGMIVKKLRQEQQAKSELDRMKSDDCNGLVIRDVGKPIAHTTYGSYYGAWMKDPLEYLGPGRIWIMDGYYNKKIVKEFASYTEFKAGIVYKTHLLPYYWDGTGAVVYGPYLYYNRYGTNYIVKYDLRSDKMITQRAHGYYNKVRSYYYQWGGYSGMDLAVDESGLWVLSGYSGYSGKLAVTMIDPTSLVTRHVWNAGGEAQNSMGNAFVACGVVYMIDAYSGKTSINRAYDTKTGASWNPKISFEWPRYYGVGGSLDYNPKEKLLYAWVGHHQVTYSLKFGRRV